MKKKDIEGKYNLKISLEKCAKCDICNGYLNSRGYCRRCLGLKRLDENDATPVKIAS